MLHPGEQARKASRVSIASNRQRTACLENEGAQPAIDSPSRERRPCCFSPTI